MSKQEKLILTVTSVSHLAVHVVMLIFPAILLTLKGEFHLGLDHLGLLASISAFMFGVGALPAGYLESKVGGRLLLVTYLVGSGVVSIMMIWVHSVFSLGIGLATLGLFSSIYHPAGLTIISHRVKHLSRGMAIHGIAGSIGLAIGPLFASILSESFYWQFPYLTVGILNLMLAIIVIIFVPKSHQIHHESNEELKPKTNKQGLLYYYGYSMIMGFVFGGFSTFLPALFSEHTQTIFNALSPTVKGGLFTSLVFSVGTIGQTIGGYAGSRLPRARILTWVALVNIPILIMMGLSTGIMLILVSLFLGIFYFLSQPVGNALVADLTHHGHRGLGYGISFFLSFGVGGFSAGIGGWLAEKMDLSFVFIVLGIILIPAAIFASKIKHKVST